MKNKLEDEIKCPVCLSTTTYLVKSEFSDIIVCENCNHMFRKEEVTFDYLENTMIFPSEDIRLKGYSDFLKNVDLNNKEILEIGCSTGRFANFIDKNYVIKKYDVIEYSDAHEQSPVKFDNIYKSDITKNILENKYDLIIALHVIEHIFDFKNALKNIFELLNNEGLFLLEVPFLSGHPLIQYENNPSHQHWFSVESITKVLNEIGYKILKIRNDFYYSESHPESIVILASKRILLKNRFYSSIFYKQTFGLEKYNFIVIWGAGKPSSYDLLDQIRKDQLIAIVDSSEKIQGERLKDFIIKSPDIIRGYKNITLIIHSLSHEKEIEECSKIYSENISKTLFFRDLLNMNLKD